MYKVEYDLYIHVRGEIDGLDYKPTAPDDILDEIIPDECTEEILSIVKDPSFAPKGYMTVIDEGDDEDED